MKKAIWLLLLAGLLACGPTTANPQAADTDAEEDTAVSAEQSTDETAEETGQDNDEPASSPLVVAPPDLDGFAPASTVEEAAVIREQDWRKGAAEPVVVIIEYGDFQ